MDAAEQTVVDFDNYGLWDSLWRGLVAWSIIACVAPLMLVWAIVDEVRALFRRGR
jgi:hypothetical protein